MGHTMILEYVIQVVWVSNNIGSVFPDIVEEKYKANL